MTPEELVGQRITEFRERLGLTQQQLGERVGDLLGRTWPRQTVSAAERGKRAFTATELIALAQVLSTYPGRLLVPSGTLGAEVRMPSGVTLARDKLAGEAPLDELGVLRPAVVAVRDAASAAADQLDANKVTLARLIDAYESLGEALRGDAYGEAQQ